MLCGARVALAQGDDPRAENYLKRAVALQPFIDTIFVNMGVIEWRRGNLPYAEANFRYALMLNPNKVEALYNLGLLHLSLGRKAHAEAALRRALALRPGSPEIQRALQKCRDADDMTREDPLHDEAFP